MKERKITNLTTNSTDELVAPLTSVAPSEPAGEGEVVDFLNAKLAAGDIFDRDKDALALNVESGMTIADASKDVFKRFYSKLQSSLQGKKKKASKRLETLSQKQEKATEDNAEIEKLNAELGSLNGNIGRLKIYKKSLKEYIKMKTEENKITKGEAIENAPVEEQEYSVDETENALMPEALKVVMEAGTASISLIQRKLGVGYARAARILDQMVDKGYVESTIGAHTVKITKEQYNELFGNAENAPVEEQTADVPANEEPVEGTDTPVEEPVNEEQTAKDKKVEDFIASLDDEQKEALEAFSLERGYKTINDTVRFYAGTDELEDLSVYLDHEVAMAEGFTLLSESITDVGAIRRKRFYDSLDDEHKEALKALAEKMHTTVGQCVRKYNVHNLWSLDAIKGKLDEEVAKAKEEANAEAQNVESVTEEPVVETEEPTAEEPEVVEEPVAKTEEPATEVPVAPSEEPVEGPKYLFTEKERKLLASVGYNTDEKINSYVDEFGYDTVKEHLEELADNTPDEEPVTEEPAEEPIAETEEPATEEPVVGEDEEGPYDEVDEDEELGEDAYNALFNDDTADEDETEEETEEPEVEEDETEDEEPTADEYEAEDEEEFAEEGEVPVEELAEEVEEPVLDPKYTFSDEERRVLASAGYDSDEKIAEYIDQVGYGAIKSGIYLILEAEKRLEKSKKHNEEETGTPERE